MGDCGGWWVRSAVAVADELHGGEEQGEEAGGEASHGEHEGRASRSWCVGPWWVTPPKTVKMSAAERTPVPKMMRPVRRSLRVSGCIGAGD